MARNPRRCYGRWADFEITGGDNAGITYDQVQTALAAVRLCHACPLFDACTAATKANRPIHRCVQAGVIWEPVSGYKAVPVNPAMWAKRHAPAPAINPVDAPPCKECGAPLPSTNGGRRFCSLSCKYRDRNRKVAAKAAAAPCDICGGHRGDTKHERIRHAVACQAKAEAGLAAAA